MNNWHSLDNAAKIFPAVNNNLNTSIFRVSVLLYEPVQPEVLQSAVNTVVKRYPFFSAEIKKGTFWNFLTENDDPLFIEKEKDYPCFPLSDSQLLRVLYFNRRISVEVFHSLTDGSGATEFLKTIMYQYLKLLGKTIHHENLILLPEDRPSKYDTEDSFKNYYSPPKAKRLKDPRAYKIQGTDYDPYGHNVIHGVVNASKMQDLAKKHGVTITAYITSLIIYSIYSETMRYGINNDPVSVAIPVNLRRIFPSKTLRNFFTVINVHTSISNNLTFDMILDEVSKQLQEKTEKNKLKESIAHNVYFEKNYFIRLIPLFIKNIALKQSFDSLGDSRKTMTLSNLGVIKLPLTMSEHIVRMELVLYPTRKSPINCGICSVNNQLTITFTKRIVETDILQSFFNYLTKTEKIDVKIFSNDWGTT